MSDQNVAGKKKHTELKPGDRVRVYCANLQLYGAAGTVADAALSHSHRGRRDIVAVELDRVTAYAAVPEVHVSQCRRLKKRERRRVWVNSRALAEMKRDTALVEYRGEAILTLSEHSGDPMWCEFVEVKR